MKNYNLNISAPTDGRYSGLCEEINKIFSEHNLIKMRVKVEIEWFIFLSNQNAIVSCDHELHLFHGCNQHQNYVSRDKSNWQQSCHSNLFTCQLFFEFPVYI